MEKYWNSKKYCYNTDMWKDSVKVAQVENSESVISTTIYRNVLILITINVHSTTPCEFTMTLQFCPVACNFFCKLKATCDMIVSHYQHTLMPQVGVRQRAVLHKCGGQRFCATHPETDQQTRQITVTAAAAFRSFASAQRIKVGRIRCAGSVSMSVLCKSQSDRCVLLVSTNKFFKKPQNPGGTE